jgi:elongator complex protein 3
VQRIGDESTKQRLRSALQVKPMRTQSGVATVTILTKPWCCPGKCVFCPADVRMPKSYLANEPGAQRAETNYFDPYLQVMNRLQALHAMGHNLSKVELIILGGSWDSYPLPYQIWFMTQVFVALNDFGAKRDQSQDKRQFYQQVNAQAQQCGDELIMTDSAATNELTWRKWQRQVDTKKLTYNQVVKQCHNQSHREQILAKTQQATWAELSAAQDENSHSQCRNVGLVIETRPDLISEETLMKNRRFGCTKIQLGVQSVNDEILRLNGRGMSENRIAESFALLRQWGFKIHAHMMANLVGANVVKDIADYEKLVTDPRFIPDEIKLYPCSLLSSSGLMQLYQQRQWQPYSEEELLQVLVANMAVTPPYIRITRMIRDFSSNDIVAGNKKTNFRQLVDRELTRQKIKVHEIRTREIKGRQITVDELQLRDIKYQITVSEEHFLQWVTSDNLIAGFLRLSLPNNSKIAMIREIHVYGVASVLAQTTNAQHLGLGKKLVQKATELARKRQYRTLRVISAVGTREYYRNLGFHDEPLYQVKDII